MKPKTQVSVNDPDARCLGSRTKKFVMGYNGQAAVDQKNQIILAAEIQDSTNDAPALPMVIETILTNCISKPENILADAGYGSESNVALVEMKGMKPIISMRSNEKKKRLLDVRVCERGTSYVCKAGYRLKRKSPDKRHQTIRVFVDDKKCENCEFSGQCSLYDERGKMVYMKDPRASGVILRYLERIETEEFKQLYKRRQGIVEPVFGNLKTNKKLEITVVGRKKVGVWWKLVCTALNIEKIVAAMAT